MKKLLNYLNPIAHLGDKSYSLLFPFTVTLIAAIILEFIFVVIVHNPDGVGLFAIFIFISLIVYFAFREGVRGGFISAFITLAYYLYIIYSRAYQGQELRSGIETTAVLGALYLFIAWIIGWLKERIDSLIEIEANEKRRLQTIIDQLPVGIVLTDNKGTVVQGNKQIEMLLGRKIREKSVVGVDTDENATYNGKPVGPNDWPLAEAFAKNKAVKNKEFILNHRGAPKHILVNATLIRNREEKIIAAASMITDISAQKELEKRKDDFINMASHELKTPITSMKLYIDSLDKRLHGTQDTDVTKMIKGVKSQTIRLQNLVNDMLDVTRLQTGKLLFTKETTDLRKIVYDTVDELQDIAKNHQVSIIAKSSVNVHADAFRLYQVIANLLTNALKYSPEGTKIFIRLEKKDGNAVLSVRDEGIGIDEAQITRVFDRLYQVHTTNEKSFPGLGMGLFIAKEIIKQHKGKIWVVSKKDKGSTFFFSIPSIKKGIT